MFSLSSSSDSKIQDLHRHRARCLLLGQTMVGKTSLIRRLFALAQDHLVYVDTANSNDVNNLNVDYLSDQKSKHQLINDQLEPRLHVWQCPDLPVELFLLDSSGRSLYQDWLAKLTPDSDWLIIGVFDLTSSSSLSYLRDQISRLFPSTKISNKNGLASSGMTAPLSSVQSSTHNSARLGVLVGTRADLVNRRQVRSEEALQLARQLEFGYFECNTCEGADAQLPFRFLAENLIQLTVDH